MNDENKYGWIKTTSYLLKFKRIWSRPKDQGFCVLFPSPRFFGCQWASCNIFFSPIFSHLESTLIHDWISYGIMQVVSRLATYETSTNLFWQRRRPGLRGILSRVLKNQYIFKGAQTSRLVEITCRFYGFLLIFTPYLPGNYVIFPYFGLWELDLAFIGIFWFIHHISHFGCITPYIMSSLPSHMRILGEGKILPWVTCWDWDKGKCLSLSNMLN